MSCESNFFLFVCTLYIITKELKLRPTNYVYTYPPKKEKQMRRDNNSIKYSVYNENVDRLNYPVPIC